MSNSCQQNEITSAVATGWTQIDLTPLNPRSYVEIINSDLTQSIGVWITSGTAPSSQAWNSGQIVQPGDQMPIVPAGPACAIYVKTQTGAQSQGSGIILREWS